MFRKIKYIICGAILAVVVPILFFCGIILLDSVQNPNEIPSFFGWKPFVVMSGSMEPEILPGDLVMIREIEPDRLKEGDILSFQEKEVVITHRILRIEEADGERRFITKGDNNNTEDHGYVLSDQVEGRYEFRIPKLGNLIMELQTPTGMLIALSIPMALLMLTQNLESKEGNNKKGKEEET